MRTRIVAPVLAVVVTAALAGIAVVLAPSVGAQTMAAVPVGQPPSVFVGDFQGDGKSDIALLGTDGWLGIPLGLSRGDGRTELVDAPSPWFAGLAAGPTTKRPLTADYNGDGATDFALVGGAGWTTIPVAMSHRDGTFDITNASVNEAGKTFAGWAQAVGAQAVVGKFNNDSFADIALIGGAGWHTVPIAFSNGDGTFDVRNPDAATFAGLASENGTRPFVGDFDGNGCDDIALTPTLPSQAHWFTVPLVFANCDKTIHSTNVDLQEGASALQVAISAADGPIMVAGRFDADTKTDLAVVSMGRIQVLYSKGDGDFSIPPLRPFNFGFSTPATGRRAQAIIVGRFNNDAFDDIVATPGPGVSSMVIPMALSLGAKDGQFNIWDHPSGSFPGWAAAPGAKPMVGDFDGDGLADLGLIGGAGWVTVPMLLSQGGHHVTNGSAPELAGFSTGAKNIVGNDMDRPLLTSVAPSGSGFAVSWTDKSDIEDGFRVMRRLASGGPLTTVATKVTTSRGLSGGTYSAIDVPPNTARYCYEVQAFNSDTALLGFSDDACTSGLTLPAVPAPLTVGNLSFVDTAGGVSGISASMAVGTDGKGIVAHYGGDGNLRVSHCDNVECTTVTTTEIDTAGDVGQYSSVKIGGDGLALVSYVSIKNAGGGFTEDLKVAHCNNVACTAATVSTVDSGAMVNDLTSLAIGADGFGLIAYQHDIKGEQTTPVQIKVAHCTNAACTASTVTTVDSVGDDDGRAGGYNQVGLVKGITGFGVVVYADGSTRTLKVAACTNADCTQKLVSVVEAAWTTDQTMLGGSASIALGADGLPLIAYHMQYQGHEFLKTAHCVNVYCTAASFVGIEDKVGTAARTSVAVGGDGLGVISYYDQVDLDLKLAHCNDVACTSATITVVDGFDDVGSRSSVVIGPNGLPYIAVRGQGINGNETNLRVVQCPDVTCTGILIAPF